MAARGSSGEGERNPNNGMHPTGKSADVVRNVDASSMLPGGDAGRSGCFGLNLGHKREACRSRTARGFSQFKVNDAIAGCTAALPLLWTRRGGH
jgi:hypothetical protein